MPVIHALHCVLIGLFVVTNLLLIPIAAIFGAALGSIAADQFNIVGTGASLMLVVGGFMGVGIINGSLTIGFMTLREIEKSNRILASLRDVTTKDRPVQKAATAAGNKPPRKAAKAKRQSTSKKAAKTSKR